MFLDTHVLLWLHKAEERFFSERASQELQNNDLVIAPIVLLELQYLHETKKLRISAETLVEKLQKRIGLRVANDDGEMVTRTALSLSWTRDPFDRLIVAHAIYQKAKLLTKDRIIHKHFPGAVW